MPTKGSHRRKLADAIAMLRRAMVPGMLIRPHMASNDKVRHRPRRAQGKPAAGLWGYRSGSRMNSRLASPMVGNVTMRLVP